MSKVVVITGASRGIGAATAILAAQRDLVTVGKMLLSELTPLVNAQMGVIYQMEEAEQPLLRMVASYAGSETDGYPASFKLGQGLIGQCAIDRTAVLVKDVDKSVPITSALSSAPP